jgi:hypothetical protein
VNALAVTHPTLNYTRDALRRAFPSGIGHDRQVVTLTAYFDESGTHKGATALSIAGYIASAEAWAAFDTEWHRALADFGLPYFHMADFVHGIGAYAHWQSAQKNIRFGRLVDIINSHAIQSFGTAVPMEPFDRIFSAEAKAHCGGAYGLAATSTFLTVGQILRSIDEVRPLDLWVAYIYELGAVGSGQVLKVFEMNRNDPIEAERLRLDSLMFQDKRKFVALQAADILAYELYRHYPRQMGLEKRPTRRSLQLLAALPHDWGYLDEAQIRLWSEVISLSARIAKVEGWPHRRLPDDWQFPDESES